MQTKLIVSAAAISLVAGLGTASAADLFATLEQTTTEPLTRVEMAQTRGALVEVIAGCHEDCAARLEIFNGAGADVSIDASKLPVEHVIKVPE